MVHPDGRFRRRLRRGRMARQNAFIRDGDRVFRTYFVNNRGDEQMGSTWNCLDITALGRQEEWEDLPQGYPELHRTSGGTGTTTTSVAPLPRRNGSRCRMPEKRRSGTAATHDGRSESANEVRVGGRACDANGHEGGTTASLGATDWLSLAAAPTFAIIALLTSHGGGPGDILCSTRMTRRRLV